MSFVIEKLSKVGLFTKERGSIPLYRQIQKAKGQEVRKAVEKEGMREGGNERSPPGAMITPLGQVIIEAEEGGQEPKEETPLHIAPASRADLEGRMKGMEGRLVSMEATLLEIKKAIKGLNVTPQNLASQPTAPQV